MENLYSNMKRFLTFIILVLPVFFSLTMTSCQKETKEDDTYIVSGIQLPSSLDVYPGKTVKITVLGTPPAVGDEVLLVSSSGEKYAFPVSAVGDGSFYAAPGFFLFALRVSFHRRRYYACGWVNFVCQTPRTKRFAAFFVVFMRYEGEDSPSI